MNSRDRASRTPEINITPMIDCVFLLLVFFMVTTVFSQSQVLKVTLPHAKNYDVLEEKRLIVAISSDKRIEVNGRETTLGEFMGLLEMEKSRTRSTQVIIKADEDAPHGVVIDAMDVARRVGVEKISLGTEKPGKEGPE